MSGWLTLKELSDQYRAAAEPLRARLAELRKALNQTADPVEVWSIKRRIAELTPILTEMNALTELTEHYYDRGYYRDERFTTNGIRPREGLEKAKANQDRADGTYTSSDGYTHRVCSKGAVTDRRSKRTGRKQVDDLPYPRPCPCETETVRPVSVAPPPDQLDRLWSTLGL